MLKFSQKKLEELSFHLRHLKSPSKLTIFFKKFHSTVHINDSLSPDLHVPYIYFCHFKFSRHSLFICPLPISLWLSKSSKWSCLKFVLLNISKLVLENDCRLCTIHCKFSDAWAFSALVDSVALGIVEWIAW